MAGEALEAMRRGGRAAASGEHDLVARDDEHHGDDGDVADDESHDKISEVLVPCAQLRGDELVAEPTELAAMRSLRAATLDQHQ